MAWHTPRQIVALPAVEYLASCSAKRMLAKHTQERKPAILTRAESTDLWVMVCTYLWVAENHVGAQKDPSRVPVRLLCFGEQALQQRLHPCTASGGGGQPELQSKALQ